MVTVSVLHQKRPDVKTVLLDIRFWLILFFVLRLYAITLPPLEFQHAWRQTDGLMIARNFYEGEANIFYPRVDTAGEKTGITGSEFPILNYLIYLVATVFSYQHWYGRLIVLIVSTLGCFYFYKSIRKFFDEPVAFNSTILLIASYWFSYSRKIFPDCFGASLVLIALYFVLEYLEKGGIKNLLLFFLLGSLGGLAKISVTILLSVLAIPVFFIAYPIRRKIWMLAFSALVIITICGWYYAWVPYLNKTYEYGGHFTTGLPSLIDGWNEILKVWPQILRRLFIVPFKYLGLAIFTLSLLYVLFTKRCTVFSLFVIPYILFLVVILKTGSFIIADQYYVLCIIPAMAFISGFGLAQVPNKKIMLAILAAAAIESMGAQVRDFRRHKINKHFENLETIVDKVSARKDLFVMNTGVYCPTAMYFAHRKGWTVENSQLANPDFLADIKRKGCKYVLISKELYGEGNDITLDLPQLFESEAFRIYSLQ